jgi:hypothetical protein
MVAEDCQRLLGVAELDIQKAKLPVDDVAMVVADFCRVGGGTASLVSLESQYVRRDGQ